MSDVISKLIDKISTYLLLNNVIPGVVYIVLIERLTSFKLQMSNIWINLVLYFYIGLVIGRVGSFVIEPFLKHIKKLKFVTYLEYIKAEQSDNLVRELSMISNMYRTYSALGFCVLITIAMDYVWMFVKKYTWSKPILEVVICIILIFLFTSSFIKQNGYVSDRVEMVNELNKEK